MMLPKMIFGKHMCFQTNRAEAGLSGNVGYTAVALLSMFQCQAGEGSLSFCSPAGKSVLVSDIGLALLWVHPVFYTMTN
jgi:hypothetical protein